MELRAKFRVYLVISTIGLTVSFFARYIAEVSEVALIAYEGVVVAVTGILLVTGVYMQGFEEGFENGKTENKNETEMHSAQS